MASPSAASDLIRQIPSDWQGALGSVTSSDGFLRLAEFVSAQRRASTVYPAPEAVFRALRLTPYAEVRAVILGQDPYHRPGQADGLAFSVRDSVRVPPSLRNIHRELVAELGVAAPNHGSLEPWSRQGVLLLNTVLTVREGSAGSHRHHGWEELTDAAIRAIAEKPGPVVFLLWGTAAKAKAVLVDAERHIVIEAAHPSPYSVRGFRGRAGFERANRELRARKGREIDWSLG